ncbi:MAG: hypothetical protein ACE5IO_06145 [Thermoplasmata archaeon]
MAVKCKDCGFVNENDSIIYRTENGRAVFMSGSPHSPAFICIKCGSKRIVSHDE